MKFPWLCWAGKPPKHAGKAPSAKGGNTNRRDESSEVESAVFDEQGAAQNETFDRKAAAHEWLLANKSSGGKSRGILHSTPGPDELVMVGNPGINAAKKLSKIRPMPSPLRDLSAVIEETGANPEELFDSEGKPTARTCEWLAMGRKRCFSMVNENV